MTPSVDFHAAVRRSTQLEHGEIAWPVYDLQRENAELAERIEKFWRDRGFALVKTWTELEDRGKPWSRYCVRSNLVNGVPPR